jgi:hypothetical protein
MKDIFVGEKTVHVYSTLTNSQQYPVYRKSPQGENIIEGHVHIKGDAGLANKHLVTSLGSYTAITPEALQHLRQNVVFQQHEKNGFITVREKKVEVEAAVSEHTSERDNSAPLTPSDYVAAAELADADEEAVVAVPKGMTDSKVKRRR